jgi:hypothetical protein
MKWITESKDLLGVLLAVVAIALSFSTVIMNRRQSRRAAFLQLHESLTSPDLQRGRRLSIKPLDPATSRPMARRSSP